MRVVTQALHESVGVLTVSDLKRGQYWTMGVVAIGYAPSWAGVIVVVVVAMALCYCPTFTARRQPVFAHFCPALRATTVSQDAAPRPGSHSR